MIPGAQATVPVTAALPVSPLPLPVLIDCIEERVAAVHQGARSVGSLLELMEQALPHLQLLNRLESSSVL